MNTSRRSFFSLVLLTFISGITLLSAQSPVRDTTSVPAVDVDGLRSSMVAMHRSFYRLITSIDAGGSLEGADAAIRQVFDSITVQVRLTLENPEGMNRARQALQGDPELVEWKEKIRSAVDSLQAHHPAVAAEFQRTMKSHYARTQGAIVGELGLSGTPGSSSETGMAMRSMLSSLIAMSRELYTIVVRIHTMEQVAGSEGRIGEVFDRLVDSLRPKLTDSLSLRRMQSVAERSPVAMAWSNALNSALARIRRENPEVAAELERVMRVEGAEFAGLLAEARSKGVQGGLEGE